MFSARFLSSWRRSSLRCGNLSSSRLRRNMRSIPFGQFLCIEFPSSSFLSFIPFFLTFHTTFGRGDAKQCDWLRRCDLSFLGTCSAALDRIQDPELPRELGDHEDASRTPQAVSSGFPECFQVVFGWLGNPEFIVCFFYRLCFSFLFLLLRHLLLLGSAVAWRRSLGSRGRRKTNRIKHFFFFLERQKLRPRINEKG